MGLFPLGTVSLTALTYVTTGNTEGLLEDAVLNKEGR